MDVMKWENIAIRNRDTEIKKPAGWREDLCERKPKVDFVLMAEQE